MLVKICCIQSSAEVEMARLAGATHVGLVGAMPSGPGPISDERIGEIAQSAHPSVVTVLLTSESRADSIVDHVRRTEVRAVQCVRPLGAEVRAGVRAGLPDVQIIQVVHVEGESVLEDAEAALEGGTDILLLDSGRPSAPTAELGGTGRTHDWRLSAEVVRRAPVPVFLAGGLRPENVEEAIGAVGPHGVDLCSGVRGPSGGLDGERLRDFMEAVGRAGRGRGER